jgi:hypothetical protein
MKTLYFSRRRRNASPDFRDGASSITDTADVP